MSLESYISSALEEVGGTNASSIDIMHAKRTYFTPNVFSIPDGEIKRDLVSVMMPFSKEFDEIYQTVVIAGDKNGLSCKRADDIWENSVVIQDIFYLIFRSYIVGM
jgi:hypothetical protein